MTRAPLAALAGAIALAALAAPTLHAEDPGVAVLVETADGSVLAGTLAATTELTLTEGGKETKLSIREVRRVAVWRRTQS